MEFRPCIDIHNGKVKQIVGASLRDGNGNSVLEENFVSEKDASYYAALYRDRGLFGGHVILLDPKFQKTKEQAFLALQAYPGGLQVGGGITPENAALFLEAGASHVIVTSYVFREGRIDHDRLHELAMSVGREHLVLDMSCKKTAKGYVVVTDRWQRETTELVDERLLAGLEPYCDEFLIHAVDVEGKAAGIDEELVTLLGNAAVRPMTYAGGVRSIEDLALLKRLGKGRVNVTIGSALDLFGGSLKFEEAARFCEGRT